MNHIQDAYDTYKGEGLKTAAEVSLQKLGANELGAKLLEYYASGGQGRIVDPRLVTDIGGVEFENPAIVGAGWDKQGRAIHGLYHLGFGGAEIGTVPPRRQTGEPQPRVWTIDKKHSVGLNRLAFNSPGADVVDDNLAAALPFPFPIGLNVGRNKDTPNSLAAEAHSQVIRKLGGYASYIVLGISSPNTPGLRGLQDKEPLREQIQAAKAAMPVMVPLFIKIDAERTDAELHDMIEVVLEEGATGFVATNTYMGSDLKARYGKRWANEAGGLSGNDLSYQGLSTRTIRRIYEEAGNQLIIIGGGGVNDKWSALEKIQAGASAFQVVTAMKPSCGRVAYQINAGLVELMDRHGASSIRDYIGLFTNRGPLA